MQQTRSHSFYDNVFRPTMSEQLSTTTTKIQASFTMEHLRAYLYGHKKVQLIDTTKLQKERIKHLHINKEPKGNSCKSNTVNDGNKQSARQTPLPLMFHSTS